MTIGFDNYGVKVVTQTDHSKSAYVPNREQRKAIESAGIAPAVSRPAPAFKVTVLSDPRVKTVKCSYYYSLRKTAAKKRAPEPRMGHAIISSWLNVGDTVLIGNVGSALFAKKISVSHVGKRARPLTDVELATATAKMTAAIVKKAKKAKGVPKRKKVKRNDFVRNIYVVAAAMMRANGKCEMPGCKCALFVKDDGKTYLEGHHIVPLSEGGADELSNAAALCPHCHRVLHFSRARAKLRIKLAKHIAAIPF